VQNRPIIISNFMPYRLLRHLLAPLAATLAFGFGQPAHGAASSIETIDHTRVQLVTTVDSVAPGSTFWIGLRYQMDPEWHIYWKNYGETGIETQVEWNLPDDWQVGPIQWPVPERHDYEGIISYVYHDDVVLYAEVTVPDHWSGEGETVSLEASTDFLMCSIPCIPGAAQLSIELPVEAEARSDPAEMERWQHFRQFWPQEPEDWNITAYQLPNGSARLVVHTEEPLETLPELTFFSSDGWVEPSKEQSFEQIDAHRFFVDLTPSPAFSGSTDRLLGVLAHPLGMLGDDANPPLRVDTPLREETPPGPGTATLAATDAPRNFLWMLVLAFFGGLILNLMPCVFPVLGIKVMGFVQQAGEERSRVALHGLVFTAGVVLSFWILAGLLIALRAGGEELGWGFQLQSPAFVFFISLFLLLFALNLSGVFAFGLSAVGVGSKLTAKPGFNGSFFSGVLATIVATPCAAPLLAPALGFALTLPPLTSLIVFTAIAVGLASPYLILSLFPGLASSLPRPGAWMESLKQFMAFPLYATVAFLVWILADQVSPDRFLQILLALVLGAMAAWVYGRWVQGYRSRGVRTAAAAVTLAFFVASPVLALYERTAPEWEPWSRERVEELVAADRPIYVDFTARWCLTCQVNKRNVFRSEEVQDYFRRHNVAMLIADWTNNDPAITAELARFERSTVPFNLVYRPGADKPIPLPELLTPGIVLDAFRGNR